MTSMAYIFSWQALCAPLDENEVRYYQTLEQWHVGEYIRIKVRVRHELCVNSPQQPSLIFPFDWFLFEQTVFVPYQEFQQNSLLYMQLYFPIPIIPYELMHVIMPYVMTYVEAARNTSFGFHYESPRIRVFPLVLDIFVQMVFEYRNNFIANTVVLTESMEEAQFVPATNDAIESLENVKLEDCDTVKTCVICQIDFNRGMEVTKLPCDHMYHQECIVQWLETSHMCPMCRHAMPTSTGS